MNFKKFKQTNKGITLIALVITIIVLLILAGVTIATLTGDNGILTQANNAKERTEQAEKDEKNDLANTEDIINKYANGIEVEQVTDENPGSLEGSGTETNPYVINSIEDLVFFAHDVTNGNTYEGEYVSLGLSLDFNSSKSYVNPFRTDYGKYGYDGELKTLLNKEIGFIPIGSTDDIKDGTNCFKGTFDGKYKSLYNIYMDKAFEDNVNVVGFFSSNFGTIQNLKLDNVNYNINANNTLLLGGILGRNFGTITNCSVSGNIIAENNGEKGLQIGGIVGQGYTNSKILECFNKCELKVEANSGSLYVGGIVGYMSGSELSKCYNKANINVSGKENAISALVAGIVGYGGSESLIKYHYNTGNISCTGNYSNFISIAGIMAYNDASSSTKIVSNLINFANISSTANSNLLIIGGTGGIVNNSDIDNIYNYGKVDISGTNNSLFKGLLIGSINNSTLENSFYKEYNGENAVGTTIGTSTVENVKVLTEDIEVLDILGEAFENDTTNINGGYPILSWQRDPTMDN